MRLRVLVLVLVLVVVVVRAMAQTTTNFSVTNNGFVAYDIAGMPGDNPPLTLVQGQTYNFQVNASGHPFFISTVAHSPTGPHFTNGVSGDGVQVGTLAFVVPTSNVPTTLFYQCENHSAMSGQINIVAPAPVPATGTIASVVAVILVVGIGLVGLRRRFRRA
jgi:hypothetical protein